MPSVTMARATFEQNAAFLREINRGITLETMDDLGFRLGEVPDEGAKAQYAARLAVSHEADSPVQLQLDDEATAVDIDQSPEAQDIQTRATPPPEKQKTRPKARKKKNWGGNYRMTRWADQPPDNSHKFN